ncbi:MAG: hypothetical protein IKR76_05450, partial [Ruminococcus sp.]|nr:hypothetical protein [Ruminococcus sp.]
AAMLGISAAMLATSTYAWFTMNTEVSVDGMSVKAMAEKGIIIRNETTDTWAAAVSATYAGTNAALLPTSTADVTAWYYNTSDDFDDAEADQDSGYTELNLTDGDSPDGVYSADGKDYYLKNIFYIKSSGEAVAAADGKELYITNVNVTGSSSSPALDKSLRVAIKVGDTVKIFAPFDGATASYNVQGTTSGAVAVTAIPVGDSGAVNVATGVTAIPSADTASVDDCVKAEVYMYFEGEDAACKSSNIKTTLDTLSLSAKFELKASS